jgi:hypothetical protein
VTAHEPSLRRCERVAPHGKDYFPQAESGPL